MLGDVGDLAASIREVDYSPRSIVTPTTRLVAGLHRLRSLSLAGWTMIPARVVTVGRTSPRADRDRRELRPRRTLGPRTCGGSREAAGIIIALHPEVRPVRERGGPGRGGKKSDAIVAVFSAVRRRRGGEGRHLRENGLALGPNRRTFGFRTPQDPDQADAARALDHGPRKAFAYGSCGSAGGREIPGERHRDHEERAPPAPVARDSQRWPCRDKGEALPTSHWRLRRRVQSDSDAGSITLVSLIFRGRGLRASSCRGRARRGPSPSARGPRARDHRARVPPRRFPVFRRIPRVPLDALFAIRSPQAELARSGIVGMAPHLGVSARDR